MEKLIRENFMAEWEILDDIHWTRKSLKENKEGYGEGFTDDIIDIICDEFTQNIQLSFYKVRTEK